MIRKFLIPLVLFVAFSLCGCKISGMVTHDGTPLEGVSLTIAGENSVTIQTGADGTYEYEVKSEGTYVVSPKLSGYTFSPESRTVTINSKEGVTDVNFQAIADTITLHVPGDYASIQAAIDAASPGYRILVADGEYGESLHVNKSLTLESENGYSTTVLRVSDQFDKALVSIQANDVTIRGFSLIGKECTGFKIMSDQRENDNVVHRRCTLENNLTNVEGSGIEAEGGTHQFLRNYCTNSKGGADAAGIFVINSDRDTIVGNHCHGNDQGIALYDYRLPFSNDTSSKIFPCQSTIADNTLENNEVGGIVWGAYNHVAGNTFINNQFNFCMIGPRITVSGNSFDDQVAPVDGLAASGTRSEVFLNNFESPDFLQVTKDHDVRCFSKNTMYHFGGKPYVGVLGNYISSHDLSDNNGDGIADNKLNITPSNAVPVLAHPFSNYRVTFSGKGLSGRVVKEDGTPAQEVSVLLTGKADISTMTDTNGTYAFSDLDSGTYKISMFRKGYFFPSGPFYITIENNENTSLPVQCPDLKALVQKTVHVPDDYATIQDAANGVNNGDIIRVSAGTYPEIVTIDKPLSLISDEGANATFISGTNTGAVFIGADQVTVQGFTIQWGIYLGASDSEQNIQSSSNTKITHNRTQLIAVHGGMDNTISNNTGMNEDLKGLALQLKASNGNTVSGNTFSSQQQYGTGSVLHGIYLQLGDGNIIRNNLFIENEYGMELQDSGENYVFLNRFQDSTMANFYLNGKIFSQSFQSPKEITYLYGEKPFTGYLGNFYSDHELTDVDSDGITEESYFIGNHGNENYYDIFPLAAHPEKYTLQ